MGKISPRDFDTHPRSMMITFLTHNIGEDNGGGVLSRRVIEGLAGALSCAATAFTSVSSDGVLYEQPLRGSGMFGAARSFLRIRAAVRKSDAVHAFDVFPYGFIAALAAWGTGTPLVVTAMGSGSVLPLYRPFIAYIARFAYRRAARITAISAFTRTEILKKMPELEIAVINPGVDAEEFTDHQSSRHHDHPDTPYILSVGRLRWRKGYHFSIRAFGAFAARFPDMKYVIAGTRADDAYYQRLVNLIAELGLEERVIIKEDVARPALIELYKNAELFCLFSQNVGHDVEGFGIVFLEAAAAGLPVVGAKNCGVDDAVEDGKNGILVTGRSPDDFAAAIVRILSDEEMKRDMSAESRAFAARMTWARHIPRYAALYRAMLEQASWK